MLGVHDFLKLAEWDYQICLALEKDLTEEYAQNGVLYHIQQAVEKLLKAILLTSGINPEYTHNIVKLAAKCSDVGIALPACLDDISDALTLWEVSSRYDPFIVYSEKKYEKAKEAFLALDELAHTLVQPEEEDRTD